ncbi:MAG: translation initiation factor IF-2 N-terminal domain-containing protein, partial [Proteobacteria bacterium]|nr:translation initiation factor IF-2 N-terminal domain-containing protein [Pseudomonadota bacterium]
MSKVRIYDLAKEFGLKSKELADRLVAMGFAVTSPSSSVDDDVATAIRRKLRGGASPEPGTGRIELRNKPEPAAKTSTVIRRRSKADKEEAAKKQEEVEALALEAEIQALEERLQG